MHYRVGQRVRFLHESGDGIITALIDKNHVEVDMGDDFPIDMHVRELIPVDVAESKYLGGSELETSKGQTPNSNPNVNSLRRIGSSIFTLSLAVCPKEEEVYDLEIFNPGLTEAVYTCYMREKNKYTAMASGKIQMGEVQHLFSLTRTQLGKVRSFYCQIILFTPGKSHPHSPITQEIVWNKGKMIEKMKYIDALNRKGWTFSLTELDSDLDKKMKVDSEFMRIKKADVQMKEEKLIDLHIESLVERAWELAPSSILDVQMEHMEKGMSQALLENYRSLILIHGVGEGVLRNEIKRRLKQISYIDSSEPADPKRFGNGATKIYFK